MNTKNRIKILSILAVLALVVLPLLTASALTVEIMLFGEESSSRFIRTWSGEPAKVNLNISGAVTDVNDLTIEWTTNKDSDPNWVWSFEQEDPADPNVWIVTCTKPVPDGRSYPYPGFTATVTDDVGAASDLMEFLLYDDACGMGKIIYEQNPTDLNADCITNLADFAIMATAWLEDYTATAPIPIGL